jgi:hypothetical protein
MRKEKTDRDPDLEVPGHGQGGHKVRGVSGTHRSGQVSGTGVQEKK